MKFITKVYLIIFPFIAVQPIVLYAQEHNNFRLKTGIRLHLKDKWDVDFELHHRRQNGYNGINPFSENLRWGYRSWVHYQLNSDLRISLSPIAYYLKYKVIEQAQDVHATPSVEWRFVLAASYRQPLFSKLSVSYKPSLEYRVFPTMTSIRWPNSLSLQYGISEHWHVTVFEELFLNIQGIPRSNFFDKNQAGLLFTWKGLKNATIDFGYMRAIILPLNKSDFVYENNLLLDMTYKIKWRGK